MYFGLASVRGWSRRIVFGVALASVACGEAAECDLSQHPIAAKDTGALGFSAQQALKGHTIVDTRLGWADAPEWFDHGYTGVTQAHFTFQATGTPFESKSDDLCEPYVGIPVVVGLTTEDGAVETTAKGEFHAFSEDRLQIKVVFDSRNIAGGVAPTGGVDLLANLRLLGSDVEGSLSARLVRMTESSLSVKQDTVGILGVAAAAIADAGAANQLDAAAPGATSGIILPPAPPAATLLPDASHAADAARDSAVSAGGHIDAAAPDAVTPDAGFTDTGSDAMAPDAE